MKHYFPNFYKNFKCIASKCTDSCCKGWEIDIDKNTLKSYTLLEGAFGSRLKSSITTSDGVSSFRLTKDEKCPFLNENKLCDIILNIGESYLCEICREHPRFNNWYGSIKETGICLCCEEAARIILSQTEPMHLESEEIEGEADADFDMSEYEYLYSVRSEMFKILQNREENISKRLISLLKFTKNSDFFTKNNKKDRKKQSKNSLSDEENAIVFIQKMKIISQNLEYMQEDFESLLHTSAEEILKYGFEDINEFFKSDDFKFMFENIAVYFIYRYFLESVYDGTYENIAKQIILFIVQICFLIYGKFLQAENDLSFDDYVWCAKLFSKEVEYSEDNLMVVGDECYVFAFEECAGILKAVFE